MSVIEFDSADFLEYIDKNLDYCFKIDASQDLREKVYKHVTKETNKYINTLIFDNNTFVVVDEIGFMLTLFEIFDEQTNNTIDMKTFLEKLQSFTKRHRNISKSLDKLVTKIEKHDIELNNKVDKELFQKEVYLSTINFSLMFGCLGFIMSFVNTFNGGLETCFDNDTMYDFEPEIMF